MTAVASKPGPPGPAGPAGPAGPPGPPGSGGGGAAPYEHDQAVPAASWVVVHNLGEFPTAVQVIDSAGTVVLGAIHHDSPNQLTLSFSAPFGGKARVST